MNYHFVALSFRPGEYEPFFRVGATGHKAKAKLLKALKRSNPRANHRALKCTAKALGQYGGGNCIHAQ